jgi:hypothetical protein
MARDGRDIGRALVGTIDNPAVLWSPNVPQGCHIDNQALLINHITPAGICTEARRRPCQMNLRSGPCSYLNLSLAVRTTPNRLSWYDRNKSTVCGVSCRTDCINSCIPRGAPRTHVHFQAHVGAGRMAGLARSE